MYKIHHIIVLVFVLTIGAITAQNNSNNTLNLIETLHNQEMESTFSIAKEMELSQDKKVNSQSKEELLNSLLKIYETQFTVSEIKELTAFYNSPLGKKLIKNQTQLNGKISETLMNWEMKLQGIDLVQMEQDRIKEEKMIMEDVKNGKTISVPQSMKIEDPIDMEIPEEDPLLKEEMSKELNSPK